MMAASGLDEGPRPGGSSRRWIPMRSRTDRKN